MRIENFFDLQIATFDPEEIVPENVLLQPGLDLIRIHQPTVDQRARFLPMGFVYKPTWIFWLCPVYKAADEYLFSLSEQARRLVRASVRRIQSAYQTQVEFELKVETFERWLSLYEKRMSELPRSLAYAVEERDEVLANAEKMVGIYIYDKDHLIAGGLGWKWPHRRMLRMSYYASDSAYHHLDLTRYFIFVASGVARELGYDTLSVGADPNFYGHAVSTGLYLFKKQMGFRAEHLGKYESDGDENVLEKVLSLAKCADPSFCVGYADPHLESDQLEGHVFSGRSDPDLSCFEATFLKHIHYHYVPERRSDVEEVVGLGLG